jgi:hypothetical protein
MKLYSFSLIGAVIALSFGAGAGLHFKSVKPLAVATSQPAAIAMPTSQAGAGTASLNLRTMKITPANSNLTGFVERTAGGVINPLSAPLQSNPNPPAVNSNVKPGALTGTN